MKAKKTTASSPKRTAAKRKRTSKVRSKSIGTDIHDPTVNAVKPAVKKAGA